MAGPTTVLLVVSGLILTEILSLHVLVANFDQHKYSNKDDPTCDFEPHVLRINVMIDLMRK